MSKRSKWKKSKNDKPRSGPARTRKGIITIIETLLSKRIGGSSSKLTALEAIIFQLWKKSLAGNKRATAVLMQYRRRNPELIEPQITVIGGLPDPARLESEFLPQFEDD